MLEGPVDYGYFLDCHWDVKPPAGRPRCSSLWDSSLFQKWRRGKDFDSSIVPKQLTECGSEALYCETLNLHFRSFFSFLFFLFKMARQLLLNLAFFGERFSKLTWFPHYFRDLNQVCNCIHNLVFAGLCSCILQYFTFSAVDFSGGDIYQCRITIKSQKQLEEVSFPKRHQVLKQFGLMCHGQDKTEKTFDVFRIYTKAAQGRLL